MRIAVVVGRLLSTAVLVLLSLVHSAAIAQGVIYDSVPIQQFVMSEAQSAPQVSQMQPQPQSQFQPPYQGQFAPQGNQATGQFQPPYQGPSAPQGSETNAITQEQPLNTVFQDAQRNPTVPAPVPNLPVVQPMAPAGVPATDVNGQPIVRSAVPLSAPLVGGPNGYPGGHNGFVGGLDEQAFVMCAKIAAGLCYSYTGQGYQGCLNNLKERPACDQFINFARLASYGPRDEINFIRYYNEGQVTLVHVIRTGEDYPGDYYLIGVNGSFLNITAGPEVKRLFITKDLRYPEIITRFPNAQLWSVVSQLPVAASGPNGGLRLTFKFSLLNGCATCDLAGYANVAYDFSDTGTLQQVSLLSLDPL